MRVRNRTFKEATMRRAMFLLGSGSLPCLRLRLSMAQTRTPSTLDIYVIDVEGGNATLFVSPSRESLLIDTGNAGAAAARDAGRIMEAIEDAGLQQIDHLITTHWHGDHFGGMAELASKSSDPRVYRPRPERPAWRSLPTPFSRRSIRSSMPRQSTPSSKPATRSPWLVSMCAW